MAALALAAALLMIACSDPGVARASGPSTTCPDGKETVAGLESPAVAGVPLQSEDEEPIEEEPEEPDHPDDPNQGKQIEEPYPPDPNGPAQPE